MNLLDIDAYLDRIGWGGSTVPTLPTLEGLLAAHMASIPFENLDVLLGRGIRLDLEGVQAKLVRARRGGYCFEHGTLFSAALERLGFDLARHAGRVTLGAPREEAPRTHMFLVVTLPEGRFVVDPGFGGLAPSVPLPLVARDGTDPSSWTQTRTGADHHFAREGELWVLKARTSDGPVECWVSPLDAAPLVDFELGNHFTSTHPASKFRRDLTLRALVPGGRVSVLNRDVTFREAGGKRTEQLADRRALRELLARHFGFDLPEVEAMRVPAVPGWG